MGIGEEIGRAPCRIMRRCSILTINRGRPWPHFSSCSSSSRGGGHSRTSRYRFFAGRFREGSYSWSCRSLRRPGGSTPLWFLWGLVALANIAPVRQRLYMAPMLRVFRRASAVRLGDRARGLGGRWGMVGCGAVLGTPALAALSGVPQGAADRGRAGVSRRSRRGAVPDAWRGQ